MKKLTVILFTVLFWYQFSFAQSVANYAATRNTGVAYSSIYSSSNAVNTWRNIAGGFQQDDNRSDVINIGFDFWYNGVRYTQLSVSTNGYIDFSSSTDDGGPIADDFGYVNSAFSAATSGLETRPACAIFYDDLTAQGGTLPLGNSIRYRLTGTAPNRTLTVEWINMAVYTNTTPSLNFQIKLFERTGVIQYNYGTMNTGTFVFTYTLGINAPTMSSPPTTAQLKNQITANTTIFSNTPQNGLTTLPASNSQIVFTPPVPLNPTGLLTFSSVTSTSMTLNWTNWATNEVGYVIYNSTDGVNYTFVTQTAANATTQNVTGLLPGTTYFWRVYAVTEGTLSNALSATQATAAAGNKVSNMVSGDWNNPLAWLPVGVPTLSDNVTILNGHNIRINTNALCNNLTVGQGVSGILRIGNDFTSRTITVGNNITINTGAQFITNTASDATHNINIVGNIVNNGILNFAADANSLCTATFAKNGNQSISGTGGTNNYSAVVLNMGLSEFNTLTVSGTNFSAPANFLTLNNGTFKLANTAATAITLSTAATFTIVNTAGFTLNNPNATVTISNNLELIGNLRIDAGTFTVGNAANETLTSNGGELTIAGGALNVAGRYVSSTINNLSRFVMSNGIMTVPTVSTSSTTNAPFNITSPGSVVNISGGTIIIPNEGGTGAQNLGFTILDVINSSVTGGVLQIGNASTLAAQTMRINTVLPVGNLHVVNANATAQQAVALTILKNVNIPAGVFDANNLNTTVGGNWTDIGNFLPGTATVTFNGTGTQTITDPTGEHFNNIICSGPGVVALANKIDVDNDLTIATLGTLDAGPTNNLIDIQGDWINGGIFNARQGVVNFNGTALQQMSGTATTTFFDLNTVNAAGVNILNGNYEVIDAYTPVTGNFNVTAATSFTLLSDATRTARIGQVTTGSVTGNMRIQRFVSARGAGYSDMASPVVSTTIADWDNELLLVYAYSPPTAYPSAYAYDESSWDYVPVTSTTEVLTPGKGFEVYLDSDGTYTSFNNTTIDSRGVPKIGSLNVSSSITFVNDGWNLIGNPYASFISWDNLRASSAGINSDIMIFDEVANDFEIISGGTSFEIPPHQGFWVEATTASPTLIFNESNKTTTTNSSFKAPVSTAFSLVLKDKQKENFFSSKTVFIPQSQGTYPVDFRAVPHPLAPQLYSLNEIGAKFRRNVFDETAETIEVPLGFKVGENGMYTINALYKETVLAQGFTCIGLKDNKANTIHWFTNTDEVSFYASVTDSEKRFTLVLSKKYECEKGLSSIGEPEVSFVNGNKQVSVAIYAANDFTGTIRVVDMLGQPIQTNVTVNQAGTYAVNVNGASGYYLVYVTINGKLYTHKYFKA